MEELLKKTSVLMGNVSNMMPDLNKMIADNFAKINGLEDGEMKSFLADSLAKAKEGKISGIEFINKFNKLKNGSRNNSNE
jgi:hypothetical protein